MAYKHLSSMEDLSSLNYMLNELYGQVDALIKAFVPKESPNFTGTPKVAGNTVWHSGNLVLSNGFGTGYRSWATLDNPYNTLPTGIYCSDGLWDWAHYINMAHRDANGFGAQIRVPYHGYGDVHFRSASGGTWGPWYKIWCDANFNPEGNKVVKATVPELDWIYEPEYTAYYFKSVFYPYGGGDANGTRLQFWGKSYPNGSEVRAFDITAAGNTVTWGSHYIGGNCSALTFTDRTPFYSGDALTAISAIKGDGNGNINHETLPEFARKKVKEQKQTGKKIKQKIKDADGKDIETEVDEVVEVEEDGRDLGAMISILTVAVQQLTEICNRQQEQIDSLLQKLTPVTGVNLKEVTP